MTFKFLSFRIPAIYKKAIEHACIEQDKSIQAFMVELLSEHPAVKRYLRKELSKHKKNIKGTKNGA